MPIVIPPFWGKYPDAIAEDKRRAEAMERQKRAENSPGTSLQS